MTTLRQAIEDSMQDIGLGTDERLDRATERVRAVIFEALYAIESPPYRAAYPAPPGSRLAAEQSRVRQDFMRGYREGCQAALEAVRYA